MRETKPIEVIYLNYLRRHQLNVRVTLVDGRELEGNIIAFDNHTVVLEVADVQQLIYKKAISHIDPQTHEAFIYDERRPRSYAGAPYPAHYTQNLAAFRIERD